MLDLSLFACDINTRHSCGFSFRSNGAITSWLFMCFKTPFYFNILNSDGCIISSGFGNPGDCLLHPPGTYISHGPTASMKEGFINDWIYFYGDDAKTITDTLNIPVNRTFQVNNTTKITNYLQDIIAERDSRLPASGLKTSLKIFQILMILESGNSVYNDNNKAYINATKVREQIRNCYSETWDLDKMAKISNYSKSRFAALYKQFFKISPIDDLINIRVSNATNMLMGGEYSVEQVAEKCGFSSIQYFSRIYKQITGVPPSSVNGKIIDK